MERRMACNVRTYAPASSGDLGYVQFYDIAFHITNVT
jgi:hypothetical protein